ncbi:MAG: inovirus-type Gp2 protein [Methylicorpusculum sp.]|uniref:YagK/YfjJ domain-containing protein n=1 Tax=Methylicorpusculum sp. TaxID=2713644 RepID=UPI0027245BB3|nr:inovirus-type Gp2 protein [Methylicorpusculum sp.]MDO8940618.1 inovirus-type Gp2 protein [Methylicorpusculum sp.]
MNNLSDQLAQIGQLTQTIINQPNDPLYIVTDQGNGWLQVQPTQLAISIGHTVEQYLYALLEQFPIHDFHPFIGVFIRNVVDCNLKPALDGHRSLNKTNNLYQIGVDYEVMLDLIIRMRTCVKQILEVAQSSEIKEIVNKAQRTAKNNQEGMMRYIDSLFNHYSRLVVIRIDLHEDGPIMNLNDIEKKYWQAKNDFQHLLNNAKKNSLFDAKVGHIWSLEYGPERGFHYHLVLFLDGSMVRDDVYFAWEVGEYWTSVITKSRGTYWNCNAHKKDYKYCGIGLIHYSEVEKINNLKQASAYLIKVDYYARVMAEGSGKTFGRGEILPPRTGSVGRPRTL